MRRFLFLFLLLVVSCANAEVPDFTGTPLITINDNIPNFTESGFPGYSFVSYSELDSMGRVGVATACIGNEYPAGARSSILMIEPTGWNNRKYDIISGGYLYNRSHLIAHRFAGGGDVIENLFTGTQYLNQDLMVSVENVIADYVDQTGHHVLYRVTPDFREGELVCRGVEIEAQAVEDQSVAFHIYAYNIQPGIAIDYRTGESRIAEHQAQIETRQIAETEEAEEKLSVYVVNTNTKRFHRPTCHSVSDMKPKNRKDYTGTREELIIQGYKPCGECNP